MRYIFLIFFFTVIAVSLYGQNRPISGKGIVSYISSQNVYVKFESTDNINVGDTLFISNGDQLIPALIVDNKSSISCVCTPLSSRKINVSDELLAQKNEIKKLDKIIQEKLQEEKSLAQKEESVSPDDHTPRFWSGKSSLRRKSDKNQLQIRDPNAFLDPEDDDEFKEHIKGRVSIASYNSISGARKTQTMRYAFSFRGNNLGSSRFSVENYITFRHTINEWDEVKDNLGSALKVYSLALKYDFSKTSSITLGRRINPRISSMGAIDGLQFKLGLGNFILGGIVGSRPDYLDYGFNIHLPQYGAYISHESHNKDKFLQSTLAFIEQRNNSKIDRRFIYFQHSESLLKNLYLFTSVELSLYENINNEAKNILRLNNLYLLLRYRLSKKLNFSASYDNRKNVIFYESYKNFIDKLIEDETRQGVRFHINYRPFNNVSWGINTGWRYQKNNTNTSQNLNSYVTFSRITSLNILASLNADFLRTNYLNSRIFGIRISKEIIPGRLSGDIYLRNVYYRYINYETATHQNIVGGDFSLKIIKKLSLYMYYEGIFEDQNKTYNRLNVKIIQRF